MHESVLPVIVELEGLLLKRSGAVQRLVTHHGV